MVNPPAFAISAAFTGYDLGDVMRCEIREMVGKHQLAIVDFLYQVDNVPSDLTPVAIEWGFSPNVRTLYGYVNHTEKHINQEQARIRVYVIGTSQPMNSQNPKSWTNMTPSYIAKSVAREYSLRSVIHKSTFQIPYWTSANWSDFTMMNKLADKVGYNFWVDGSTMYFVDPASLIQTADSTLINDLILNEDINDTLGEFRTVSGPLGVPGGSVVQTVFGIDRNTSRFIQSNSIKQATDANLPLSPITKNYPQSVNSLSEAYQVNQSAVNKAIWSQAEGVTFTLSNLHLGSLVNVSGNFIDSTNEGIWLVNSDIHVYEIDEYGHPQFAVELTLVRNQQTEQSFSTVTTISDALAATPARLVGSQWEAQVMESVYV